ncbi:hypothetical protein BpHYR1_039646 [Brachionus plicatilis]|uniref:Transmembrane protein n=1 Tax=Brachionus plicatilis TaxID=10195 RepID=A0A3M7S7R6_BRAPC|nr:hypothetical protein BpHYR1_039646 [Brachionus plicatilis]
MDHPFKIYVIKSQNLLIFYFSLFIYFCMPYLSHDKENCKLWFCEVQYKRTEQSFKINSLVTIENKIMTKMFRLQNCSQNVRINYLNSVSISCRSDLDQIPLRVRFELF